MIHQPEGSVVVNDVRKANKRDGLNPQSGEIERLVQAGVIDGGMPDTSEMRRVVPRDATIHAEHDRVLWLLRDAGGHSLSTAAMRDAAFVGWRP